MADATKEPRIGILALQGDFQAHARVFERLGVPWSFVRRRGELAEVDSLILPGGESTTFLKFLSEDGFLEEIRRMPALGKPLFGTCAGAILLAKEVKNPPQPSLGLIDMTVARNAYGRQVASTVEHGRLALTGAPLEMVFIRAPLIERVGPGVKMMAWRGEQPVFVQQGLAMATTFHPELSRDTAIHEYFLRLVRTPAVSAHR